MISAAAPALFDLGAMLGDLAEFPDTWNTRVSQFLVLGGPADIRVRASIGARIVLVVSATTPLLRRATRADIGFLATVVLLGVEERYQGRPGWDRGAFYRGLTDDAADQVAGGPPNSVTYVIVNDRVDVGRLRLVTTAHRVEIAGVQVLPDHQNRGIGTAVITHVTDEAAVAGLPVALDVEIDNPDARRLYERLLFRVDGPVVNDRQPMIWAGPATADARTDSWRAGAEHWAHDQLASRGRQPAGAMTEVSVQAWSAVWRVPTTDGTVLVKQATSARRHEGTVLAFCAEAAPEYVDTPLAVDPDHGRILLTDGGPTLYDADPESRGIELDTVLDLVTDYARFQQATIGQHEQATAAGVPTWNPGSAAQDAEQQAAWLHQLPDTDSRHITTMQRDQIRGCLTDIEHAGRHLADSAVPYCLDHGDLWPGNVLPARSQGHYRFIDFGDAAWTHPFVSMIMMVIECRYRWSVPDLPEGLNLDHPALREVLDTYLAAWTSYAPCTDLQRTLRHALRIAPLRRSRAWITNLAQADQPTRTELGHMPWAWLEDLTTPILVSTAR